MYPRSNAFTIVPSPISFLPQIHQNYRSDIFNSYAFSQRQWQFSMDFDISYTFFLNPEISLIPTIINIGKTSAAKIPIFRLSFSAPEIIPT